MEMFFIFYLILIYGLYCYVCFAKQKGTIILSGLNIFFSFFVLLHLLIDFSIRSVYLLGFLMIFMISIIGMAETRNNNRNKE